jgi:hypothetical protein
MSSDGELFQEQVEDALYKKYPVYGMQVRYHFVQMPDWAPLCWDRWIEAFVENIEKKEERGDT